MDEATSDQPRPVAIRPLREDDAEAFVRLRREALVTAPLAFASSPDDDLLSDPATVREHLRGAPASVILGVFDGALVGAAGLYRDRHLKSAHKAHVWGMYVAHDHRRRGHGKALLDAVIRYTKESLPGVTWMHLGVSAAAPDARRLYEAGGFRPWGTEPDALRHDGVVVSEVRMALRI